MKEIKLTQGKIALVDEEDFERLNQHKWCIEKGKNTYYAIRKIRLKGKRKTIYMHREIMGEYPVGLMSDHINGDGLRNLRSNLRFVTSRQNAQNMKNITKTSQYPGVSWHTRDRKWQTQIRINGNVKNLGRFTSETDAFNIYQRAVYNLGETMIGDL